ncbi:MAG: hypothetical protein AAGJ18_00925 [Bacteroidota bacterium]
MQNLLLILGLTVLYYAVLIYWDRKRRRAFKLTQKKVIGKTTPLPREEKQNAATALFGTTQLHPTALDNSKDLSTSSPTPPKSDGVLDKLTLSDEQLEKDLEDLALDLDAEQPLEPTNDQLAQLAATEVNQETIAQMMNTIKRQL